MYQTQYTRNNHFQRSDSEFGKIITVFKFIPIFVVLCFYHTRARNYQPFSNLMMAHTQVIRLCVCVCVCGGTLGLNTELKCVIRSASIYKDIQLF